MAQVKLTASVASQEKLADGIYSMWIDAEPVASQAKAGQFVSVSVSYTHLTLPTIA